MCYFFKYLKRKCSLDGREIIYTMSEDSKPGERALKVMKLNSDVGLFKVPKIPPLKRKPKVLEEEHYLEQMGKIIERDFFPDLEKLKDQNEYLDALSQNDSEKIREIYSKYSSGKRPPTERFPSPATFETPQNVRREHDPEVEKVMSETDKSNTEERSKKLDGGTYDQNAKESELKKENAKQLKLDQYLTLYNSEDNESFKEIQKESDLRWKMKYAWLYKDENAINNDVERKLKVPSIEQQAAGEEKSLAIDTWTYKNQNYCMYVPEGVEPSEEEQLELIRKQREIVHENTNFRQNPFDDQRNKDTIHELALNQAKCQEGKIGIDGKIITCNETPKINGMSLVRTPSPAPGVNESPLITWGEIEGTPFLLSGGDTPYISSPGPKFRIPEIPKREKIAMALADKASESYRDRKRRAIEAARSHLSSQTPKHQSSSMSRLNEMSPAAQRLASASLGCRFGTDISLRESYSPSPRRKTMGTPYSTPSPKTPGTPRTPNSLSISNVKLKNFIRRSTPVSVTDDLLKLPRIGANRPKASDFF